MTPSTSISSSHSASLASSRDVEDPEDQEPVKQPCCTWNCCCGRKMSWRDILIIPVEGVTGVASLTSGVYGGVKSDVDVRNIAFTVAGVFAAVFAVTLIIHYCWRKDAVVADLTKATNTLEETGNELEETAEKVKDVEKELREENERLKGEVERLEAIPKDLKTENEKLAEKIEKLNERVAKLKQQSATLDEQNQQLTEQLDKCREAIDTITKHIGEVNQLHEKWNANANALDDQVGKFGSENKVLELAIGSIDKTMDENIAALKEALTESQQIVNQAVGAFSGEIQRLQKEVEELKNAEHAVDKDEDDVRDRLGEIQKLNLEIAEKEAALEMLKEEIGKRAQAFEDLEKAFEEREKAFQSTETKLSGDRDDMKKLTDKLSVLTQPLGDLEKRLSKDLGAIKHLGETLQSQKDEINKL
jgi:chromosome segregation ATPase